MIFTAYFDEADTHGPSPTIIMAAHIGHAYQWRRFETKLKRLQSQYCFKVFHVKDFKARTKEFSGWDDQKCGRLVSDLTDLIRKNLTLGMVVFLERARYMNEYRAPPVPRKMNLDSQYGVCFRACFRELLRVIEARKYRDRLNIVMEDGHENIEDCRRIFNDLKARYRRIGHDFLGAFSTNSKESCPPLMASDFLAGSYSMMRRAQAGGAPAYADIARPPGEREAGLVFLELLPDALTGLKTGFEKLRQMEIDEWRARRKAKEALVPSSDQLA